MSDDERDDERLSGAPAPAVVDVDLEHRRRVEERLARLERWDEAARRREEFLAVLPRGEVDRSRGHFVLLYGEANDSPDSWEPIAWLGGSEEDPVIEITDPLPAGLRRESIENHIRSRLMPDGTRGRFFLDGETGLPLWRESLHAVCGSSSNWYGRVHWSYSRGERSR